MVYPKHTASEILVAISFLSDKLLPSLKLTDTCVCFYVLYYYSLTIHNMFKFPGHITCSLVSLRYVRICHVASISECHWPEH